VVPVGVVAEPAVCFAVASSAEVVEAPSALCFESGSLVVAEELVPLVLAVDEGELADAVCEFAVVVECCDGGAVELLDADVLLGPLASEADPVSGSACARP
jgi:hypothetical protein